MRFQIYFRNKQLYLSKKIMMMIILIGILIIIINLWVVEWNLNTIVLNWKAQNKERKENQHVFVDQPSCIYSRYLVNNK